MSASLLRPCVLAFALVGSAQGAGAQVPWADPIGTSPSTGGVPYAEPIGASRLNPGPVQRPLQVAPRRLQQAPPTRRCYRATDAYGRVVTRCTLTR